MKALWLDYKEIIGVLRKHVNRFIKYQIATKILLAIIFLPLFKSVFNLALKSRGMPYLTNGLMQKFLISPQGVLMVVFSLVFGITVVMIEMGGLIVLSHQVLAGEEESSYFQVIFYALKRMKRFIGLDGGIIPLYLFLIAPMINSNIKTSVLSDIQIPGFIMDVISDNEFYSYGLMLGALLFFYLSIRWMFSLHYVLLDDEKHFLRASGRLVIRNWRFVVKHSLIVAGINLLILAGVALVYIMVSAVLLLFFAGFALEPVGLLLFSIGFLVFFGAYFLLTPFQMIHLTMIFHKLTESNTQMLALTSNRKVHIFDRMISSKKILINGFIVTVVGMSLFTWVMINEVDKTRYAVDITAHRGSSKEAPENTLASLDTAILHGASYAEIDVQETKGGGVVLTHDESLERVTGLDKMVWQVGLEEIQALDAGAWFDSKFIGEKMPTLEEAMDYSKGRLKLNIEIKVHGHERLIIGQVVKLIQEKNYYKECVVTSLDYDVLQEIERLDSKIKTGYVMAIALGNLEQLNVDFYSVEESNVTESFVSNAHLIGREVHVWTINSKASMEKMLDLGVDNIITDNDRMLSDLIRTLNAM